MLAIGYALVLTAITAFSALGPLPERVVAAEVCLLAAGLVWLWLVLRGHRDFGRDSAATTRWILLGAVLLRVVAWAGEPGLSDDIHRYVWEGGLVAEGVSPYAWAPSDPELETYQESWKGAYERINHPDVSAAYPPLAQLAHAGVVTLAGGPEAADGERAVAVLRAFFAACDLGVCLLLARWLREAGRDPRRLVAWAWCPLVIVEFAGSGHFDSLGILFAVAALTLLPAKTRLRELAGSALLAAGALVKWLPLAFLPFAARARPRRAAATLVFVALGFAPLFFWSGGATGLFRGTGAYGLRWESFSFLFRWIEPWMPAGARDGSLSDPRLLARALVGAAFLLVIAFHLRRGTSPRLACFRTVGAFLLLTPTLHPWYVCWVVPLLVLERHRAWTFAAAFAPILYWPLGGWVSRGVWHEPAWLWPVFAVPFLLLSVLEWRGSHDSGDHEPATP